MRLSPIWITYLASQVPCPPLSLTWTREHVIPKALTPNRNITEDPRNIIPLPKSINNARGHKRYTDKWENGYIVHACPDCPTPGFCRGSATLSTDGVTPPDVFKGPIARSVLYSVGAHPKFAQTINDKVLDLETAIEWDRKFPMTMAEKEWFDSLN